MPWLGFPRPSSEGCIAFAHLNWNNRWGWWMMHVVIDRLVERYLMAMLRALIADCDDSSKQAQKEIEETGSKRRVWFDSWWREPSGSPPMETNVLDPAPRRSARCGSFLSADAVALKLQLTIYSTRTTLRVLNPPLPPHSLSSLTHPTHPASNRLIRSCQSTVQYCTRLVLWLNLPFRSRSIRPCSCSSRSNSSPVVNNSHLRPLYQTYQSALPHHCWHGCTARQLSSWSLLTLARPCISRSQPKCQSVLLEGHRQLSAAASRAPAPRYRQSSISQFPGRVTLV